MTKKTMKGVSYLVQNELYMASDDHGKKFYSDHEAYASILKEYYEWQDELLYMDEEIAKMWESVKCNDKIGVYLKNIEKIAMNAACEAIQVAAMARKAMR